MTKENGPVKKCWTFTGVMSELYDLQFDVLELDRFVKPLVSCPLLLDSASYYPDTEDLLQNRDAREYWLNCFECATEKVFPVSVM